MITLFLIAITGGYVVWAGMRMAFFKKDIKRMIKEEEELLKKCDAIRKGSE